MVELLMGGDFAYVESGNHRWKLATWPNAKVSDGSQPPMTLNSSLSESAGSRSLDRMDGHSGASQDKGNGKLAIRNSQTDPIDVDSAQTTH
jgi:hypothetical protein